MPQLDFTDPIFQDVPLQDQTQMTLWLTKNPDRAEEIFAYLAKQGALSALRDPESQLQATAVLERLQFDGDVPEARTGPLPRDGTPAVPVYTDSLNPVVIGLQLQEASAETLKLLQPVVLSEETGLILYEPEHYKTGQLAIPLAGADVNVLSLTQEEVQKAHWRVISTTQGRESACLPIYTEVKYQLENNGVSIVEKRGRGEPLISVVWSVSITGRQDQNSEFNPLQVAAHALEWSLRPKALAYGKPVQLEISAYHDIANRKVGWIGGLFISEESK